MTLVVEFCGLPGAGKSSLCRALGQALRAAGVDVEERSLPAGRRGRADRLVAKALGSAMAMATSPAVVLGVARAAWSSGLRGREWLARTTNIVVLHRLGRSSPTALVLLDQGIVQELVAVSRTADARAMAGRLPAACWNAGRVLVQVVLPVETAAERLQGRGTGESRLEHLSGPAQIRALAAAGHVLDELVATAAAAGSHAWRIDGADPDAVHHLVTRIRRSAGV